MSPITKEFLINDINSEIKVRLNWHYIDAIMASILTWLSLLSCVLTLFLVLFKLGNNWLIISAICSPALVLLDKTFNFSQRAEYGRVYITNLERILIDLDQDRINVHTAETKRLSLRQACPLKITHHHLYTKF